jgi:glycosyltransferase involved in cell wall biosynthesis
MAPIKTILHITPFFSPNIGGVETHLRDLTTELQKLNYRQIVLTYSPLSVNISYSSKEISPNLLIRRFYLYGHNLFHILEKYPLLNFLYITPPLLFYSIFWLTSHNPTIDIIHSHGLNGAIIGNCLQKLFHIKKHITSIYSTYDNVPFNSFSRQILTNTLNHTDHVLTQSNQSISQLISLGVKQSIISRYYHWINLDQFSPNPKLLPKKFTVLFVGRMIPQKNVLMLIKIARKLSHIPFTFIGTGPDYYKIPRLNNIKLVGDIPYDQLQTFYQSSSVLCVPSKYHEGWGRIIAESISCGTPVISSNLGGTVEAADSTVAIFTSPTLSNFTKYIDLLTNNHSFYLSLKKHCRPYALKHYSKNNIKYITDYY